MKSIRQFISLVTLLAFVISGCTQKSTDENALPTSAALGSGFAGAPSQIKIGIVVFLSGGAAEPFGIPAKNGAEVMIASLNSGGAPAPYNTPGIAGVPILAVFADEAGGAEKQVSEVLRLFEVERVDLVIGYISSSDCLAVAPIAEQLERLLVAFDCGTSRLFEERQYDYVFRTNAHQAIDSIGGARYLQKMKPDLQSVAGINQNYAWGQDSWSHFRDALIMLTPDIKVASEQFPKIDSGSYLAEIAALRKAKPDIIHSSFWGADLEKLIAQAGADSLLNSSTLLLSVGEYALPELGELVPPGTIIGAHGPHGAMAPDNELNTWLKEIYMARYGSRPTYPVYHMSQALLGVKLAFEKAISLNDQWPSISQVIRAFTYLEFPTPSGLIVMSIGKGHQAVEPAVYGTAGAYNAEKGEVEIIDIEVYPSECVNPPEGMTTEHWIKEGFPDAQCP